MNIVFRSAAPDTGIVALVHPHSHTNSTNTHTHTHTYIDSHALLKLQTILNSTFLWPKVWLFTGKDWRHWWQLCQHSAVVGGSGTKHTNISFYYYYTVVDKVMWYPWALSAGHVSHWLQFIHPTTHARVETTNFRSIAWSLRRRCLYKSMFRMGVEAAAHFSFA